MNVLFVEINQARKLLELPESATMEEIRENYRRLIKQWHPDVCRKRKDVCEKISKKINDAYNCLMAYCNQYKFSFSEAEVEKYISFEEWWFKRFGKDPLWSASDFSGKKR